MTLFTGAYPVMRGMLVSIRHSPFLSLLKEQNNPVWEERRRRVVALTAALDKKAIIDYKARVLKEKLQDFDVVIEESVRK
jgi:hypothetical protein